MFDYWYMFKARYTESNANKDKKHWLFKDISKASNNKLNEACETLDIINDALDDQARADLVYFRPRTNHTRRFIKNIETITCQLYDQDESIDDVSKQYSIPKRTFKELVRHYLFRSKQRMRDFQVRVYMKERNEQLIAQELSKFMNDNKGIYVPIRDMITHLISKFEDEVDMYADTKFRLNMINHVRVAKILKERLGYSFRVASIRHPNAFKAEFDELRNELKFYFKILEDELKLNIIYIDECTVSTSNLSTKSWQPKRGPTKPLKRPSGPSFSINIIAARILKDKYAFLMKRESTKSVHFVFFMKSLHEHLVNTFGDEYIKHTVFVMDNASIHTSNDTKLFMKVNKFSVITLPPYSPELNKVEKVFNLIKMKLKKVPLFKNRLEYNLINVLTGL